MEGVSFYLEGFEGGAQISISEVTLRRVDRMMLPHRLVIMHYSLIIAQILPRLLLNLLPFLLRHFVQIRMLPLRQLCCPTLTPEVQIDRLFHLLVRVDMVATSFMRHFVLEGLLQLRHFIKHVFQSRIGRGVSDPLESGSPFFSVGIWRESDCLM